MAERIRSVRDLVVYQRAFDSAMKIFEISKKFPKEEMFSLTDQMRRSSISVCATIAEGWRKRRYRAVFINKLTDAEQEAAETQTWLEFALKCHYIDDQTFESLDKGYEEIYAMLFSMGKKADSFCQDPNKKREDGGWKKRYDRLPSLSFRDVFGLRLLA